jgi:hypothetical protein
MEMAIARRQQRRQNHDDADDDKKFDESETVSLFHPLPLLRCGET